MTPVDLKSVTSIIDRIDSFFKLFVLVVLLGVLVLASLAIPLSEQRNLLVFGILILVAAAFIVTIFIGLRYELFAPLPPVYGDVIGLELYQALQGSLSTKAPEGREAWRTVIAVFRNPSAEHRGLNSLLSRAADQLEKLAKIPADSPQVIGIIAVDAAAEKS